MNPRPWNRIRQDNRLARFGDAANARRRGVAVVVAGLCIAALECSQLVFLASSRRACGEARQLVARAVAVAPAPAAGAIGPEPPTVDSTFS